MKILGGYRCIGDKVSSPMRHEVILDNSFEKFVDVPEDIYNSMLRVIQGLEGHPFFTPPEKHFKVEGLERMHRSCQHRTAWGQWQLNWSIVADGIMTLNTVDAIVVTLSKTKTYYPLQVLSPVEREAYRAEMEREEADFDDW